LKVNLILLLVPRLINQFLNKFMVRKILNPLKEYKCNSSENFMFLDVYEKRILHLDNKNHTFFNLCLLHLVCCWRFTC
jgi:hypothetical protein